MAFERVLSTELPKQKGKNATVAGWVHDIRLLGKINFIVLKDRAGTIQLVMPEKGTPKEVLDTAQKLTKESVVRATGAVKEAKQSRHGGVELQPEKLDILSLAQAPVPLDTSGKIESDLSVRLDYRFLDLRDHKRQAIFNIRSKMIKLAIDYFDREGFFHINTPKLTTVGVESGAELFEVKYFNEKAYLAQSPQIYKEMMVAAGFERVYEIGAVFRAEKSQTTRHLTEFTGVDFEQGFIESEQEPMDTVEGLMKNIYNGLAKECPESLELHNREVKPPKEFPRITMKEAKKMLAENEKKIPEEEDLDAEAEKMLGALIKKEHDSEFVFVYLYPWEKRPFYHMRPEDDPTVTKSFDLIWNGLEICTGAQREHRLDVLEEQAKEKGVDLSTMKAYTDIHRYGNPPHGGAGLGLDRFVEAFLNLDNIREGILLPRDPIRLTP